MVRRVLKRCDTVKAAAAEASAAFYHVIGARGAVTSARWGRARLLPDPMGPLSARSAPRIRDSEDSTTERVTSAKSMKSDFVRLSISICHGAGIDRLPGPPGPLDGSCAGLAGRPGRECRPLGGASCRWCQSTQSHHAGYTAAFPWAVAMGSGRVEEAGERSPPSPQDRNYSWMRQQVPRAWLPATR